MTSATLTTPKHLFLHRNPKSPPNPIYSPHLRPSPPSIPTLPRFTKPSPPSISIRVSAASTLSPPPPPLFVSSSTSTITTIFSLSLSLSKLLLTSAVSTSRSAVHTAGPLFFAALRNRPPRTDLNTPLTVVAAGMSKWLDIYSGVLMVRVLLSWFPNIPWDRQPLSAIRDLCDPYLNLFRNIIPPIFDTLDVSPLLAFAVLGTLGSILNNSRASY